MVLPLAMVPTLPAPLHLVIDGVAVPPLWPQKLQGVLALLVLRHPRSLQRPWLAQTLWPDSDPDRALFNLPAEPHAAAQGAGLGGPAACLNLES